MLHLYRVISMLVLVSLTSIGNIKAIEHTRLLGNRSGKDTTASKSDSANLVKTTPPQPFVLSPIIGLGTGMFSYFGNIKAMHSNVQNPMTSRIGYELSYTQKLSPVVEFSLYALFGKLSVNERSPDLNWNFLSEIRGGGPHLLFKILPNQAVTPYIITGVESFEYLTKSDLYDQYGNKYYYWADGTIRNTAQNAPNASSANIIYRNYSFESDMRAMNIQNTGKYSLQTFAIPFGVGFMFHIGKKADFLVGSTLHYTFTNHIDGYGDSIHSKQNDMFLMSSVSLRIALTRKKHYDTTTSAYSPENMETVDFDALLNEDQDHDGVRDWDDSCPGTPAGVKVDAKGCPLDADHDGVPDYRDEQLNTPTGSVVNDQGVALSDSAIKLQYLMYMDSTGRYAQVDIQNTIGPALVKAGAVNYTIRLGRYKQGVSPDIMDKLLSVPDVQSTAMPDSSIIYTVGSYSNYTIAKKMQQQMVQNGFANAAVVYKKGKEYVVAAGPIQKPTGVSTNNVPKTNNSQPNNNAPATNSTQPTNNVPKTNNSQPNSNVPKTNSTQPNNTIVSESTLVYRVQLGAFSHKLSKDVFAKVSNLIEVKTENGYYTYAAGSFTDYQKAAAYRLQLISQGFRDAFVKAYKNGKRIPLNGVNGR